MEFIVKIDLEEQSVFHPCRKMEIKVEKNEETRTWQPGAVIYEFGSPSFEAYFIIEGTVNIYAPLGLKLNTLKEGEIFGESSILLNTKRTVSARAGDKIVKVRKIPRNYFKDLQEKDIIMNALIKNAQLRLIDSNQQSAELAKEIDLIIRMVENQRANNNEISQRLKDIQSKLNNEMIYSD